MLRILSTSTISKPPPWHVRALVTSVLNYSALFYVQSPLKLDWYAHSKYYHFQGLQRVNHRRNRSHNTITRPLRTPPLLHLRGPERPAGPARKRIVDSPSCLLGRSLLAIHLDMDTIGPFGSQHNQQAQDRFRTSSIGSSK